jgi:hypothetical protein
MNKRILTEKQRIQSRINSAKWRANNREHVRAYMHSWYVLNKEKMIQNNAEYYATHKVEKSLYYKEYYLRNKERCKENSTNYYNEKSNNEGWVAKRREYYRDYGKK